MLSEDALESTRVMLATPCYASAVTMQYVTSMFSLVDASLRVGLSTQLHMHSESLVTRARNMLVKEFLRDESLTHLFWIDSDVEFRPEDVFRLLLSGRDVVAKPYPIKQVHWDSATAGQCSSFDEFFQRTCRYAVNTRDEDVDEDGFVAVPEASTGFMCVSRRAVASMMEAYPELRYVPDGPRGTRDDEHLYWRLFDCMVDPDSGRYLSEDYAFCRRWRGMGGTVFLDTQSTLVHHGQMAYRGDFSRRS